MVREVYTPSELNREVRLHLEAGFPRLWIEGEISNLARPASGHLYFSLKDEKAQIRCALFRGNARGLDFRPEDGQQVQVRGRLSLYEPRGSYQLIADTMEEAGEGRLRAAFEALKKKLEAEGLFAAERKRPLPGYPRRLAVITSPSGAVIRDILNVLERRWPLARVRLYPVPVQGGEAPPAIVRALGAANRHGWAQAIVLGRGGGSLEDLWAFNEEAVARAVFDSAIPVVSAVGHETDFSITDFVADVRAPTPTAAAELLSPDQNSLRREFTASQRRLARGAGDALTRRAQRLDELSVRLQRQHPGRRLHEHRERLGAARRRMRVALARQAAERQRRLDDLGTRLRTRMFQLLPERRQRLQALARTLHAVSPLPTLRRGYAIVTREDDRTAVTDPAQAPEGTRLETRLARGRIFSRVEATDNVPLVDDPDIAD